MAEDIKIKITGDTKDFNDKVNNADKSVNKLKISAQSIKSGIGTAAKAGAVAFGALTAAITGAVAAYRVQEQAEIKTRATIAATGKAAGLSAEEIFKMASSLQNVTTYGDEAIIGGQNLLLTFRNIGKDTFPRATEAMLDMSAALGQDLKSSAIQLGKALNDPIAGMSALSRAGITFSTQQKDQINTMQKAGDVAGAQAVILSELENQFGGVARAAADGTGSLEQTQNILGDISETVGKAALPFIIFLNTRIKELALSFQETTAPMDTFKTLLTGVLQVGAIAKGIFTTLGALIGNTLATGFETASQALEGNFSQAWESLKMGQAEVGNILVNNAKQVQLDLEAIGQIGVKKQQTENELKLAALKEQLIKEKEVRQQQADEDNAKRIEDENVQFNELLTRTQEKAQILSDEKKRLLEAELADQQRVKDIAQAMELKKQGKHAQAMALLKTTNDKRDLAATKKAEEDKALIFGFYNQARISNLSSTLNQIATLQQSSNKALFLVGKAAALAQSYISAYQAHNVALASAPPPFNFALAAAVDASSALAIAKIIGVKGFKDGGIVGGNSITGDRQIIRANSGEMVLNAEQQASLFNLANGSGGGQTEIILTLKDNLVDFIEAEIIEKRSLGVATI